MEIIKKVKLFETTYGIAVGDAYGLPYEFKIRDQFFISYYMQGFGSHNQLAGTWSDDTSMTLATIAAFKDGKLNPRDVADNFIDWVVDKKYTVHGEIFDIGMRTAKALNYYQQQKNFLLDNDINSNGNGSLMRILPVIFADNYSEELVEEISAITHPHQISKDCCKIYTNFAKKILDTRVDKLELFEFLTDENIRFGNILDLNLIKHGTHDNMSSDGFVIHSLEAALWSFFHTSNYADAIINVVNLGGDTDTIGAITGGLAVLYYGINTIPDIWLEVLLGQEIIENTLKNV